MKQLDLKKWNEIQSYFFLECKICDVIDIFRIASSIAHFRDLDFSEDIAKEILKEIEDAMKEEQM